MEALGGPGRPAVTIAVNGNAWRSRVAAMRGMHLVGISAAHRAAAGIAEGDVVELEIVPDTAPREVAEPDDLAAALDGSPGARAAFARLPFGLRQKHVRDIAETRSAETRARRIARLVAALGGGDQATGSASSSAR